MKIGLFIPNATFNLPGSHEVGGIETFAFYAGEALQELGHDVVLFGGIPKFGRTHRQTTLRLELADYVETRSIPDIGTRFQRLVQRLHFGWKTWDRWMAEDIDLALTFKPFDWSVAWAWKKKQPQIKVLMNFQGTDFFMGDSLFYGAIDGGFAVSSHIADLAEARVGRRPAVIPNAVDVARFAPRAQDARPSPDGPLRIATMGRLVGWKGFHTLIEAIARLHKSGQTVVCDIAGAGEAREELEALIQKHSLNEHVRLRCALEQTGLRDMLASADAFVAPSVGLEAFGTVNIEAGAAGLPLLLSDQIGAASFLTDEDFIGFPAGNIEALVEGLKKLTTRRSDFVWTDRQARHERFRSRFDQKAVAGQILEYAEGL